MSSSELPSSSLSQYAGIGYRGQSQVLDEVMRSGNIPVAGPGKNGMMTGGGGLLPPTLLDENRVPKFYKDAISACGATTPNLLPNTALVYNLMVTSGLPRPVLSYIWSAANRTLPGQLTRAEFFSSLALIALAQKGESLAALSTMDSLPIPHFSAVQFPTAQPTSKQQQPPAVSAPLPSMAQQQTQSRASAFIPSSLLMFKRGNKQTKELIGDAIPSPSGGSPTKQPPSEKLSPTTSSNSLPVTTPSTSAAALDLMGIDWGRLSGGHVQARDEMSDKPIVGRPLKAADYGENNHHVIDESTLECWRQTISAVAEIFAEATAIFLSTNDSVLEELAQTEKGHSYFQCLESAYKIAKRIEQSAGEVTSKKDTRIADGLERIGRAQKRFQKFVKNETNIENGAIYHNSTTDERKCAICRCQPTEDITEYGGQMFDASCANLWVNRVSSLLPNLHFAM